MSTRGMSEPPPDVFKLMQCPRFPVCTYSGWLSMTPAEFEADCYLCPRCGNVALAREYAQGLDTSHADADARAAKVASGWEGMAARRAENA